VLKCAPHGGDGGALDCENVEVERGACTWWSSRGICCVLRQSARQLDWAAVLRLAGSC
jgi:hypothetical protein